MRALEWTDLDFKTRELFVARSALQGQKAIQELAGHRDLATTQR